MGSTDAMPGSCRSVLCARRSMEVVGLVLQIDEGEAFVGEGMGQCVPRYTFLVLSPAIRTNAFAQARNLLAGSKR
eukprot:scaffold539_cov186-Alexandrium_tamarense.AAC.8